jgi:cyclic pyranopterin phosphate synthase
MTSSEVSKIVGIAASLGVNNVKLTGGEPLYRADIVEIVKSITTLPSVKEVSMTTNASGFAERALALRKAGLKRVNVNLPTLKSELYRHLTGGELNDALVGIDKAVEVGMHPVKVNMLLLRGLNEDEVESMIDFCRNRGLILQLIELERVGVSDEYYNKFHLPLSSIEARLERLASKIEKRRFMQNRKIFHLPNVKVELVNPTENTEFCTRCARIRLTSDGKLKPCLMRNDNLVDMLTPLRRGADDRELEKLFFEAVRRRKPYFQ